MATEILRDLPLPHRRLIALAETEQRMSHLTERPHVNPCGRFASDGSEGLFQVAFPVEGGYRHVFVKYDRGAFICDDPNVEVEATEAVLRSLGARPNAEVRAMGGKSYPVRCYSEMACSNDPEEAYPPHGTAAHGFDPRVCRECGERHEAARGMSAGDVVEFERAA